MSTSALQPASRDPESPASGIPSASGIQNSELLRALRRRASVWRASRRGLEACGGARFGLWLARTACVPFVVLSLYTARPSGESIDAILRMALCAFSVFAGFAALSAAGTAHARAVEESLGLFLSRGLTASSVRAERWLGFVSWVVRHLIPLALIVLAAGLITPESRRVAQLAGLALGATLYLTTLGLGLGALSHVCHWLGRSRGQSLLLGALIVPELLSPAWPELPTFASTYSALLDACLALGDRF